jgi:folate-binding protein YgfZ
MPCVHLAHRALVKLSGEDRLRFIQGQITQDIYRLEKEPFLYTLFLTPNGRFGGDAFVFEKEGALYIDCAANQREGLIKRLTLYKLQAKVRIEPVADIRIYALWGHADEPTLGFQDPRHPALGRRVYGENLPTNGTLEDYDALRLHDVVPDGNRDMTPEKSIPLEWPMDELGAISWTKGCYVGQELTSRTKHTGVVRKQAVVLEAPGPLIAAPVMCGGDEVGHVASVYGPKAFAVVATHACTHPLTVEGQPCHVRRYSVPA